MSKTVMNDATAKAQPPRQAPDDAQTQSSEEDRSKDAFFAKVAEIAQAMIDRHGKDFAMGTLVLSARFIAEGKPLIKPKN